MFRYDFGILGITDLKFIFAAFCGAKWRRDAEVKELQVKIPLCLHKNPYRESADFNIATSNYPVVRHVS